MLIINSPSWALSHTISFTGSGAATTVDSVIAQNLTKGISVVVPVSRNLVLSDVTGLNDQIIQNNPNIRVLNAGNPGEYKVVFNSPSNCLATLSIFSAIGTKVGELKSIVSTGNNSFKVSLPSGIFVANISGDNYNFSAKIQNLTYQNINPQISYTESESQSVGKQKVQANTPYVSLKYNTGDLILLKGKSGNFTTIVTDVPTSSKTIDFNFVECKDANGNYYSIVKIGNQIWMAENLKATKFRDNNSINNTINATDWNTSILPAYTEYNNEVNNTKYYGNLYNWYAIADTKNIAPIGWKIPTDADWTTLSTENNAGDKLKASTLDFWGIMNTGTNSYGFTALPGGYRLSNGSFYYLGSYTAWWTGTEGSTTDKAYYRMLSSSTSSVSKNEYAKNGGFSLRCIKSSIPTLTTTSPTLLKSTSFTSGGSITDNGGETITEYGICWNTSTNPTISTNKTALGSGSGVFTGSVTFLTPGTQYYIRAYATNSIGTAYGNEIVVTTPLTDPITDADGNVYHIVTIGTQTWLVENSKTTRYRNGDLIGTTSYPTTNISYESSPKYQWAYNGDENNVSNYGRLYTWYVINDSRNIAPLGWHVATDQEWTVLKNYLITNGYNYDKTTTDNKLSQSVSYNGLWSSSAVIGSPGYNTSLNNSTGLSIVPSGMRSGYDNSFYLLGSVSNIWTSSESAATTGYVANSSLNTTPLNSILMDKKYGFSARCIKNTAPIVTTIAASSITSVDAICGGTVTSDGGDAVTESGVCWNTTGNQATISDSKKSIGSGINTFSSTITGLASSTTYYLRAYATNGIGTSYGEQITFTTGTK